MIRGDKVTCGTSTTGTGTLTLAACPVAAAGVDFDVFARATGIGFANGAAVLVSYTIIEYTDSTFAGAKSHEKGIGTLTLGGSSGIANCTLARTTVQSTATSLNSQPATQNIVGAGFSIGTAANTLVFIGASPNDLMNFPPYIEATATNTGGGWAGPLMGNSIVSANDADGVLAASGTDCYVPFVWAATMLVKRVGVQVHTVYTGGTSNVYARIYQVNASGQPGKRLYDFGVVGTANSSLNAANNIQSGAAGSGFLLTPGVYFLNILGIWSGGSGGPPTLYGNQQNGILPPVLSVDQPINFAFGLPTFPFAKSTGGNATAPDPANVSALTMGYGTSRMVGFAFKAS